VPEYPRVCKVECPKCQDQIRISIEPGTLVGAISERECALGHAFKVRLLETECEVLDEQEA
jgi:hypothetical protein